MTSDEFRDRLLARARNAGMSITADAQLRLEAYFRLLAQWNEKINLTALPLRHPTDQTFDRLLIEPLTAARYMADSARCWFDVGSGGGSPAIPLKIAQPHAKLTMIESKARKAAFLREAVRAVGLTEVRVENERFDVIANGTERQSVDLVTVRAIRTDPSLFTAARGMLSPLGQLFLFHSAGSKLNPSASFALVELKKLGTRGGARLSILKPVFHVEQSG